MIHGPINIRFSVGHYESQESISFSHKHNLIWNRLHANNTRNSH